MPRILTTLCCALVCLAATAKAETNLDDATWALEFQVQPSFISYSSTGVGIFAKHHSSERSAIRFGLTSVLNGSDGDGTRRYDRSYPYDTLHVTTGTDDYSDQRDLSLFLHMVRYVGVGRRIGFSVEFGPMVRWSSFEYGRTEEFPAPNATYSYAEDHDLWSYGGDIQGGFEWFLRKRLSLAARYGLAALRTEGRDTRTYNNFNVYDGYYDRGYEERHTRGFNIQTTSTAISLIAYF